MIRSAFTCAALCAAAPVVAQDNALQDYVEANLLSIFYHEFGHAIIDVMALPIFGQEEDAADTASVLLIEQFHDEEDAQNILRNAAYGFLDEDADDQQGELPLWDVHGPDLQRYYNMICQFYGGDPDVRADLADELELPEARAETCVDEFDLAFASFEPVLTELFSNAPSNTLRYLGEQDTFAEKIIAEAVANLNQGLALPTPVTVTVAPCGEANAYYDPEERSITMCSELEAHLNKLFSEN